MCGLLNEHFGSVFLSEISIDELVVKCLFIENNNHMLRNIELTPETILNKLSKLKLNKASGVDGIVSRLIVENSKSSFNLYL